MKILLIIALFASDLCAQNLSLRFLGTSDSHKFSYDKIGINIYSNPYNVFTHFIIPDTSEVDIKIKTENDSEVISYKNAQLLAGQYELNWFYYDSLNNKVRPGKYNLYMKFLTMRGDQYFVKQNFIALPPPWIIDHDVIISPNQHTKITLLDKNNNELFCLFDNTLGEKYRIKFIAEDFYNDLKCLEDNLIKIPFPKLDNDLYYLKVESKDSVYTHKFINMK